MSVDWRTVGRTEVLADEGDDNHFFLQMRLTPHYGFIRRLDLEAYEQASANALLLWTAHARSFVMARRGFLETAQAKRFVLLERDGTPVEPALNFLRRLEWTNPTDVFWQLRVAKGMPEDVVDRPEH